MSAGMILPNMAAKLVRPFSNMAGTASAIYGTFVLGGCGIITLIGTLLSTNSQLPLAMAYVGMFFAGLVLFLFMRKTEQV